MAADHTPRHDELLPAYALGALDGDEQRELEAHLYASSSTRDGLAANAEVRCPVCRAELRQLASEMEGFALLAASPDAEAPGEAAAPAAGLSLSALRERVLAQVAAEPRPLPFATAAARRQAAGAPVTAVPAAGSRAPANPASAKSGLLRFLQVAAALLLIAGGWSAVRQAKMATEIARLRGERNQLATRAAALEQRMAQVQAESERLASSISIVTAPGVQLVSLSGMGTAQKATGRSYVSEASHKAVFYAQHLPQLAPDKSYQLWVIDNDERKISVGVLQVDPRGEGSVVVEKLLPQSDIQGWVVTVEPRGGVPQPTGPIALAG